MKKYEILPHPAELRLRIYGKTLEELFTNAVFALAKILKHDAEKLFKNLSLKTKSHKLKTESVDINSLLVDFLSEILAKSQINKEVYLVSDINIDCKSLVVGCKLGAELFGFSVEHFDEDIKAVTYQDVNIQLKPKSYKLKAKLWQTDLVLDI
jgi:SHS2 domain-containing protein